MKYKIFILLLCTALPAQMVVRNSGNVEVMRVSENGLVTMQSAQVKSNSQGAGQLLFTQDTEGTLDYTAPPVTAGDVLTWSGTAWQAQYPSVWYESQFMPYGSDVELSTGVFTDMPGTRITVPVDGTYMISATILLKVQDAAYCWAQVRQSSGGISDQINFTTTSAATFEIPVQKTYFRTLSAGTELYLQGYKSSAAGRCWIKTVHTGLTMFRIE
ncbi:hypothetical protein GF407_14965 [candidate division KSB1 bacterium]|nr:hypothetical protein [candidate division KSB1 bacterium]